MLADEDRSVFAGQARRELERTLPANGRIAVLDSGHTVHRDRFEEYVAGFLNWIQPTPG